MESALFKGINVCGLPKNLLPLIHMTVFLHCNATNKLPKKTSPNKAAKFWYNVIHKHCPKQVKIEGIPMPSHTNNSWPKSYKIKYSTHQSFLSNNLEIPESPWNSLSICRKENNFWIQLQVLLLKVEYFLRTVLKTEGVVWLAGLSLLRTFQQG